MSEDDLFYKDEDEYEADMISRTLGRRVKIEYFRNNVSIAVEKLEPIGFSIRPKKDAE